MAYPSDEELRAGCLHDRTLTINEAPNSKSQLCGIERLVLFFPAECVQRVVSFETSRVRVSQLAIGPSEARSDGESQSEAVRVPKRPSYSGLVYSISFNLPGGRPFLHWPARDISLSPAQAGRACSGWRDEGTQ